MAEYSRWFARLVAFYHILGTSKLFNNRLCQSRLLWATLVTRGCISRGRSEVARTCLSIIWWMVLREDMPCMAESLSRRFSRDRIDSFDASLLSIYYWPLHEHDSHIDCVELWFPGWGSDLGFRLLFFDISSLRDDLQIHHQFWWTN